MQKYDDASWHYGGDYPKNLPNENACTHIGMFITWCIENDLMSCEQIEENKDDIQKVKKHEMTGREYLIKNCDGKFIDDDLNETGNNFANKYYNNYYFNDYSNTFDKYESFYHVEDTWTHYELIKKIIDKRFSEYRAYPCP